jgi:hypothetical protein
LATKSSTFGGFDYGRIWFNEPCKSSEFQKVSPDRKFLKTPSAPLIKNPAAAVSSEIPRLEISGLLRLQTATSDWKPSRLVQNSDLGCAVEVEELQPHFLRFDNVICHELQGNRPVMEYGLNFEHCTPFVTTSAF